MLFAARCLSILVLSVVAGCGDLAKLRTRADAHGVCDTSSGSAEAFEPEALAKLVAAAAQDKDNLVFLLDHDGTVTPSPDETGVDLDPLHPDNLWTHDILPQLAGGDGAAVALAPDEEEWKWQRRQVHVVTGKARELAAQFYGDDGVFKSIGVHPEFGTYTRWPHQPIKTMFEHPHTERPADWRLHLMELGRYACEEVEGYVEMRLVKLGIEAGAERPQCLVDGPTEVAVYAVYRSLRNWFVGLVESRAAAGYEGTDGEREERHLAAYADRVADVISRAQQGQPVLQASGDRLTAPPEVSGLEDFRSVHEEVNGVIDLAYYLAQKRYITWHILTGEAQLDEGALALALSEERRAWLNKTLVVAIGDGGSDEQMWTAAQKLQEAAAHLSVVGIRVLHLGESGEVRHVESTSHYQLLEPSGVQAFLRALQGELRRGR